MARYKFRGENVFDSLTGKHIPKSMDNSDYRDFLDSGEVADPEPIPDPWIATRSDRNQRLSATDW